LCRGAPQRQEASSADFRGKQQHAAQEQGAPSAWAHSRQASAGSGRAGAKARSKQGGSGDSASSSCTSGEGGGQEQGAQASTAEQKLGVRGKFKHKAFSFAVCAGCLILQGKGSNQSTPIQLRLQQHLCAHQMFEKMLHKNFSKSFAGV